LNEPNILTALNKPALFMTIRGEIVRTIRGPSVDEAKRLGRMMRFGMRMSGPYLLSIWFVASILLSGCSSQRIVPESMEPLVDRTVSFRDLLASPEAYKGRLLVLGGEVLNAKRLRDSTQIELLQLPFKDDEEPSRDRQQSQGRFLALQQEFLDPATMVQGTRVTIVGEVSGAKTDRLDDVEYRYPTLIVKHLHIWPVQSSVQRQRRPSIGIFGGMGVGGGSRGGGGVGLGF
jgi:outer membrane lipoprotein